MNLSGESVSRLVKRFSISLGDLLIIHDDLDLPLGKIRLRGGDSSGGHKGVASIISALSSQNFPRLRVGVGRPVAAGNSAPSAEDIISYVLSDFSPEEEQLVHKIIPRVSEAILCFLNEGLPSAMNRYNRDY
jgi:PTH1 family peptidyl-tRNA hydrolase